MNGCGLSVIVVLMNVCGLRAKVVLMNVCGLRVTVVLMNVCGLRVMAESQNMLSHLHFPSMRTWGHITSRAGNHVTNKSGKLAGHIEPLQFPKSCIVINNTV